MWRAISRNRYNWELRGSGEKDKRRSGYGESGERRAERAEAKVFAKGQRYKKLFMHATSPKSLAPLIHAFRKSCIHTSYILQKMLRLSQSKRSMSSSYIEWHLKNIGSLDHSPETRWDCVLFWWLHMKTTCCLFYWEYLNHIHNWPRRRYCTSSRKCLSTCFASLLHVLRGTQLY